MVKKYYSLLGSKTKKGFLIRLIILIVFIPLVIVYFTNEWNFGYGYNEKWLLNFSIEQCTIGNTSYGILLFLLLIIGLLIVVSVTSFIEMKIIKKEKISYVDPSIWSPLYWYWQEGKKLIKKYIIYYIIGISLSLTGIILILLC